jgi:type IV secretion system protein VirB4
VALLSRAAALKREGPVARYLPYTAHVAPAVVATAAGEYVQAFRLAGASFESADDETLNGWHERLNVLWRNLASPQVALWTHVIRRRERVGARPAARAAAGGGFAERLAAKYGERLAGETLMVNELYLALVWRPVTGAAVGWAARRLARRSARETAVSIRDAVEACDKLAHLVAASLARYAPERLSVYTRNGRPYSQLLEYLGVLVNAESQPMALPWGPVANALATTRPLFGHEVLEYRLPTATRFGAMLGIKEYPGVTAVGLLDGLLAAPFPFVLTQSFAFLSKATAQGLLQRQRARMANAGDFAVTQAEELDAALDELTGNAFVMGDHHFTLQVLAEPAAGADRLAGLNTAVAAARSLLADTGMAVAREDLALEAAFWAQLPGQFALRPRKAPISSRNFAAFVPFHNHANGRADGNHWGESLATFVTRARSAYHFSLHASDPAEADGGSRTDAGHTLLCGPTGSGKTVLVGFLVALLARRGVSQVVFDKDHGLEILVRALGGTYLPIDAGRSSGCNPLQLPDTPATVEFLREWLGVLVRSERPLSAAESADLEQALRGARALPPAARRLSRLLEFLDATRPDGLYARLARWCAVTDGEYAWAFDAPQDALAGQLAGRPLIGIDVTDLLASEAIRGPMMLYLFHCIRRLLDGRRLVCWADEFARLLADPAFERFAHDGLKVWRKLDAVFCAATQSPADALGSPIARTIVEQTATKLFMPNPDGQAADYVGGFGLTEREFALVKTELVPGGRQFLVKQGHASVVCELDLKGFEAELAVISGRAASVARLHRLIEELGPDPADWLPRFEAGVGRGRTAGAVR